MDAVGLTIGLCWLISSALIAVLAVPLMRGRVTRNAIYGVKLPQSFKSDAAWDAINRYGGRQLFWTSFATACAGIVILFFPLDRHPVLAIFVGLSPLLLHLITLGHVVRFAVRYDRADAPTSGGA